MINDSLIQLIQKYPQFIDDVDIVFKSNIRELLLPTECWPTAVNSSVIIDVNNPVQIERRAKAILRSIGPLASKKFLDFGTGHSKCWRYATEAALSIGYDIDITSDSTHNWQIALDNAKYHAILLYDVIDHLVNSDGSLASIDTIVEILVVLKQILATNGQIYVRCHPWTSRHGTHAYLNNNKAFVHYDTDQFDKEPTNRFLWPVPIYREIFQRAGLNIINQTIVRQHVEEIFSLQPFADWAKMFSPGSPHLQIMAVSFVDFVLTA